MGTKQQAVDFVEGEEWRDIPGYEGIYQASSLGRIRSIKLLKQWASNASEGYARVNLTDPEGRQRAGYTHRLVCRAFHSPVAGKDVVAHWDGDKSNNRADNLRWATQKENVHDRVRHGTCMKGTKHTKARLSEDDVRRIRAERPNTTLRALANEYGVHVATICDIMARRNWKHLP